MKPWINFSTEIVVFRNILNKTLNKLLFEYMSDSVFSRIMSYNSMYKKNSELFTRYMNFFRTDTIDKFNIKGYNKIFTLKVIIKIIFFIKFYNPFYNQIF